MRGATFSVEPGEIYGLLGPNGAGKTTTIKCVLRLIFASQGTIRIFGEEKASRSVMARVGYLPENPYVYQYLKPLEFLELCASLMGMERKERRTRAHEMVERVGLTHAIDRPIGRFSKGMMQRIGLAQALIHNPEFLILDEPMSGLDPIGRKEVRNLILEQKNAGKTLLFTSHILSDVEMLCDRVTIMNRGVITTHGTMQELLRSEAKRVDIEIVKASQELKDKLQSISASISEQHQHTVAMVEGDARVKEANSTVHCSRR